MSGINVANIKRPTIQGITPILEKPEPKLFGLSPATYGVASVIGACLAWASVWLIFAGGPDFERNHSLFVTVTLFHLPLFGLACGLLSVGAGLYHKKRLAIVVGVIGLGMIGYEAWFLSFFLLDPSR